MSSGSDSDDDGRLASLLSDELSPDVLLALRQYQGLAPLEDEEPPPPPAPADPVSGRTALEEQMARMRLADSIAMSCRDAACQARAEVANQQPGAEAWKQARAVALSAADGAASVLAREGVVRVGGALSEGTCDRVRAALCQRLDDAIERGYDMVPGKARGFGNFGTGFGFGSTRMKEGRYDMFLPTDGQFREALDELLVGHGAVLGELFREALLRARGGGDGNGAGADGDAEEGSSDGGGGGGGGGGGDATVFDWSSFSSDPGAARQPVHPDNQWQPEPPLLTALVALQDVSEEMGPTIFLPRTHREAPHKAFTGEPAEKYAMLDGCAYQSALLRKGECAVFDPRCLHCGGPNSSKQRRVLLYLSFRNPHCTSDVPVPPGSVFPEGLSLSLRKDFGGR